MPLSRLRLTERQALHLIMFVCLTGFIGALLLAISRQQQPPDNSAKRPVVRLMTPSTDTTRQLQSRLTDLQDPSLMSLPNPNGFSAPLWQHTAPAAKLPEHPRTAPAYLDTDIPQEKRPLLPAPTLADAARVSATRYAITFADPSSSNSVPEDPPLIALPYSSIQLNHGLEQLHLLTSDPPPTITSEKPIPPTQTRIAVAADGSVRYAMIERSSGNETVDEQAIRFARALHFAPRLTDDLSSGGPLIWGTARFVWATHAP